MDRRYPPFDRVIVFTGSSSIKNWKTLIEDMSPLKVVNRGFGGSRISDVTHYSDRIVLPYNPTAIIFYAGENDISGLVFSKKKTAEEVFQAFQYFCSKIHVVKPNLPIYFISIKPPKRRKKLWPEMQKANKLIEEYCASGRRLHYIDIVTPMMDSLGFPREDLFKWDGIHMNEKGYEIWTSVIKPILLETFPETIYDI